jgi:hypothetical protein
MVGRFSAPFGKRGWYTAKCVFVLVAVAPMMVVVIVAASISPSASKKEVSASIQKT